RSSSTGTTSTGSRSSATGRCRCRSTARTSATSRARSSRQSAARCRCWSETSPPGHTIPAMAQVAPGEHELRRVIDEDREVEGLDESDLLELFRSLVLLRTYDERSVVYHRQGRIGTYAIFWNHEAMQAGSMHALADDDWIFPSYRESAIGLLRGMPASTVLSWWRGHPSGWWNPADYNVASICVPIATHVAHAAGLAWGEEL